MRPIWGIVIMLCAVPAFSQNAADQPQHVKYTNYQRKAAGFWRVTEPRAEAKVAWLAIYLGDSQDNMIVRWPTGLGCQNESAEINAGTITVGGNFPAVIQVHGPKSATLSMFGGQTVLHLRKTKEKTDFLCE
jgi:hypothetical protein